MPEPNRIYSFCNVSSVPSTDKAYHRVSPQRKTLTGPDPFSQSRQRGRICKLSGNKGIHDTHFLSHLLFLTLMFFIFCQLIINEFSRFPGVFIPYCFSTPRPPGSPANPLGTSAENGGTVSLQELVQLPLSMRWAVFHQSLSLTHQAVSVLGNM